MLYMFLLLMYVCTMMKMIIFYNVQTNVLTFVDPKKNEIYK